MDSNARRTLAMDLLQKAVTAAGPAGKAAVARRLGCSRTTIARVMSPNDDMELSDKLVDRIIDRYHVIPVCPATGQEQPRSECSRLANGKAPTHNPLAMRIWKVCQACPNKPQGGSK